MKSKKGIIITIAILAGITGASFLAWLPIENQGSNNTTFVITDHRMYLDGVKSIHEVLTESTAIEFEMMLASEITPTEYITRTEATSTQITMQIREFIASKPPEKWQESYILYGESLRAFNSYLAESLVIANLMKNKSDISNEQMQSLLDKTESLRIQANDYIKRSDDARPAQ